MYKKKRTLFYYNFIVIIWQIATVANYWEMKANSFVLT
jgi:hypothetical protein